MQKEQDELAQTTAQGNQEVRCNPLSRVSLFQFKGN
jgi:hypothetical protein